jgi:hypothetical protein
MTGGIKSTLTDRPARLHRPAGRCENPMPESTISPQSGTMNLATGCGPRLVTPRNIQPAFLRRKHAEEKEEYFFYPKPQLKKNSLLCKIFIINRKRISWSRPPFLRTADWRISGWSAFHVSWRPNPLIITSLPCKVTNYIFVIHI